ncbi:MAG: CPBP family intramembrane metalloprotease [Clostridia bacterium]|nr:CPBP family intramembrane metalloprotease [Clostridia bacterium]
MKRKICILITVVSVLLLLLCEFFGVEKLFGEIDDPAVQDLVEMTLTRAIGGVIFITLLIYLGYKVMNPFRKPFGRAILFALPAIAVVVNNLPIYPLLSGIATVNSPSWMVWLLFAECFCVGLFEETCFRGVVLLGFLEKRRTTKKGQFWSIVLSSAVFGAVHFVNVFFGASPVAVLMQIGYSFLIGAMCSVVLLKTANLWLCVILHAVFNFCGAVVPTCGEGTIWEPITITITVILAVATTVYMVIAFLRMRSEELDRIYR